MENMIEIKNLSNFILKNVNLTIKKGELFVLLGPNGAGKTTLLNCIAGFCNYQGEIKISGQSIDKKKPEERNIGYLFQSLFLFPHLTVYENIAYGLKLRKMEYRERVDKLLEWMNLKHLSNRYPNTLSGGEKQKVALARALAVNPKIVLLDEPFNNLDLRTTKYLRMDFKNILKELNITAIFVTHNTREATELADRVGVIIDGKIHQIGKADEIFFSPKGREVLSFIGSPNIFTCDEYKYLGDGLTEVKSGKLKIILPTGKKMRVKKVAISPEDVYISEKNPPGFQINRYEGEIVEIKENNSICNIKVKVYNHLINCHLDKRFVNSLSLKQGKRVYLIFQFRWLKWI